MQNNRPFNLLDDVAKDYIPDNTNLVPRLAARLSKRKSLMKQIRTRPLMAAVIVLLILLALSGVAYALGRAFGYIPGVGLVENSEGLRMLAEPVSITREGVTLTITQALVYPDHIQLVYETSGITPENNGQRAKDANDNFAAFCSSPDGDAKLRLPDGTVIERLFGSDEYPENVFAMKPVYKASIPAEVTELTVVLKCIPWARLGAVPENWEVPLKLKSVPVGTAIGMPVLEVEPSGTSSATDTEIQLTPDMPNPDNAITVSLEKVVPQEDKYSFYFSIVSDKKDQSLLALYPASAYLIDSTGQKIALVYMHPWSPSQKVDLWELQTVSKPAYGPYTLVLDKIFAYYQTNNASFEFDPGQNPQLGQTWILDQTFSIGNTAVQVVSAKMVEKDLTDWGLPKDTHGIDFSFQSVDTKTPIYLDVMDNEVKHNTEGLVVPDNGYREPSADFSAALYYEKGIPADKIPVIISSGYVQVSGKWEVQWSPPEQSGSILLDAAETVSSKPNSFGVTADLKTVVKVADGYLFYLHMTAPEQEPSFRVIEPGAVSLIDSTGKKIILHLDGPPEYNATDETLWQFSTKENIATGPIQLVVEKAKAHYTNFNFDTPPDDQTLEKVVEEYSFTFDAGSAPQIGQTWILNKEFEFGGYKGIVVSAHAVAIDSHLLPSPFTNDESLNSGLEFETQSIDPAIQWNVAFLLDRSPNYSGDIVDCAGYIEGKSGSTTLYTVPCRGLPDNVIRVIFNSISVLLDDAWEIDWALPVQ